MFTDIIVFIAYYLQLRLWTSGITEYNCQRGSGFLIETWCMKAVHIPPEFKLRNVSYEKSTLILSDNQIYSDFSY